MSSLQLPERRLSCAKLTFAVALALVASVMPVKAQTNVYTDPVGFITLTAVGTNGLSANTLSFLGLGMTQIVTNRGNLTAVSGTQLTLGNPPPAAGAYNEGPVGPLYFIEIVSGAHAGFYDDIVSNDAAAVYTASDDSSLLTGSESYKIYPHWTLASVFGATDQAGLQGASGASQADQILVENPATKNYATYFYNTSSKTGGPGWRKVNGGSTTDYSTQVLYIDQGVLIQKITGTNLNVQLVGAVKLGPTVVPLDGPGNNFLGNVYATSAMTLSNSNLYTGNNATGLTGGSGPSLGDQVLIHNDAAGTYATYFWNTSTKTGGTGWRLVGGNSTTDVGTTQIPIGANVLIQLHAGNSGFNWTAPAPY